MEEISKMEKDNYVPYTEIFDKIDEIRKGDILYVVSDVLELSKKIRNYNERFDVTLFLKTLQNKVGKEGTILLPTFNWDFCHGIPFDYKKTIGKTGALGNKAMQMEGYKRSKHPLYSFVIWGKYQKELCEIDPPNSFGKGTIFEFLYNKNAKALIIGLPILSGLSYVHHIEKTTQVPYRYMKNFTANYIDESGISKEKTYSMYVRDLDMNPLEINGFQPLSTIIEEKGLSTKQNIDGIDFNILNLREITPVIEKDILNNGSKNLYVYNGQK